MDASSGIDVDMPVVAADGCAVGLVVSIGHGELKIRSVKGGRGFEHALPLSWVSEVNRYVFLNKSSRYVAAHWDGANASPASGMRPKAA